MIIETIVMDTRSIPLQPKHFKKAKVPKVSRFKLFFDGIKVGQSFTCPINKQHGIRVCFLDYQRKYSPNYKLVGRTTVDKKLFRYWAIENDKS
jgi:hypothetical protein